VSNPQKIKHKSASIVPTTTGSVDVKTGDQIIAGEDIFEITLKIREDIEELKNIIADVRAKRHRANDLRSRIIEQIIHVRQNKKRLLNGRTFTDFLEIDVGITRGHFSEQLKAYELCVENNKPEYFNTIDTKVLVGIARIKDVKLQKLLFEKAPELTREYIRNVRRSNILGKSSVLKKGTSEAADFLKSSENELSQQIGSSMYQKVFDFGVKIDKLFNNADSIESCEALKTTLQKMVEIKLDSTKQKMNE
jgi:hypothetical protein